jgi:plastocyanin
MPATREWKEFAMKLACMTVLGLGLALFGVACGGGTTPSSTPTTPSTTQASESPSAAASGVTTTTLTARDNVFDPSTFTFPAGKRITLKNVGNNLHNFSVDGQNISHDIKPGETEVEDVELAPGTYTFFCKYHRALGMQGTITVSG